MPIWSRVGAKSDAGNSAVGQTSRASSPGFAVSVNDVVVLLLSRGATASDYTANTVTDNLGNSYTALDNGYDSVDLQGFQTFVGFVSTGGTLSTVTASWTASHSYCALEVAVYRCSTSGTPSVDQHSGINAPNPTQTGTGNATMPSLTPSAANCLVVGAIVNSSDTQPLVAGSGWTDDANSNSPGPLVFPLDIESKEVAAAVLTTPTWTSGSGGVAGSKVMGDTIVLLPPTGVADTTAPTVPTNLTASPTSAFTASLAWTASTDNVAVAGYTVRRNGTIVGTTSVAAFSDQGLSASTTYSYTVDAYDAAGNHSAQTSAVQVTTPAAAALGTALPAQLPPTSGAGGTRYVDPVSGNDSTGTGTSGAPWRTVAKALASVGSGTFIRIKAGTISAGGLGVPAIDINGVNFSLSDPVTIMPDVPGTVIIQPTQNDNSWGVWCRSSSGVRIQGLIFRPVVSEFSQLFQTNCVIDLSNRIEVTGCTFNESGEKGILVRGGAVGSGQYSNNIWVYGNKFRPSGSDPFAYVSGCDFPAGTYYGSRGSHYIYMGGWGTNPSSSWDEVNGVRNFVIANNVFVGSTKGRMVEVGPEGRDGFVVNNTFYGNHNIQKYGISTSVNGYAAHDQSGIGVITYGNASSTAYKSGNNVIANNIMCDLDGNAAAAGGGGAESPLNLVTRNLAYQTRNCYGYGGDVNADYQPLSLGAGGQQFNVTGNLAEADPLFTNPNGYDYTLQPASPAIGAADPQYTPAIDITGAARNAAPSLGAYEASSGPPPPVVAGGSRTLLGAGD